LRPNGFGTIAVTSLSRIGRRAGIRLWLERIAAAEIDVVVLDELRELG